MNVRAWTAACVEGMLREDKLRIEWYVPCLPHVGRFGFQFPLFLRL